MDLIKDLIELEDKEFKEFNDKIMNAANLPSIGVRMPVLRKLAKKYYGAHNELIKITPRYTEEVLLIGLVINNAPMPLEERKKLISEWLKHVDNWAATDMCNYKPKKSEVDEMFEFDKSLIAAQKEFYVRYAIVNLFNNFNHKDELCEIFAGIKSDKYYINMAIAWGISVLLVKNYETTITYLEKHVFSDWIHNKAIQKAIESYRIGIVEKDYLRTLKTNKTKSTYR